MKKNTLHLKHQSGFVVSIVTFMVLTVMISLALSMSALIFYRQKISTYSVKSTQSYYAAEAGIEDSLMRLRNNAQLAGTSYAVNVNGATASVTIPEAVGGSRTIVSQGDNSGVQRKVQVVYSVEGDGVSFVFGVQIGAGGLVMGNNSRVIGNVASAGNITGTGTIDNDVIVAGNGNKIEGPRVKGNVLAHTCRTSIVEGNLTYVSGGVNTCTVWGSTSTQSGDIQASPLPISQSQIDDWKTEAAAGGTMGNYTVNDIQSLGPKKINGTLTLNNGSTLNVTGTLHVTGNIVLNNGSTLKLHSSYGSVGGMVVTDGTVTLSNNSTTQGSGQASSHLLLLSTSTSDTAISINNNGSADLFYASSGGITLSNNGQVKELTAYKITLQNNAVITYETGLADMMFSNGPSGGWKVTSWEEK